MCPDLRKGLGAKSALCRIFVQQQLPSQLGHVAVRSSLWKEVQDSPNVVRSWRTCPSGTRSYKRSRRKSSGDPREIESSSVSTKKLRRQEEARNKFRPRRFCLSQGLAYSRDAKVPSTRKISPSIRWTVSGFKKSRSSSIPTGATRRNVGYTSSISRLAIKEMFESTRG
jgi:hypothetical protein